MCWEDVKIGLRTTYKLTSVGVTAASSATAQLIVGRRANRTFLRVGLDNGNCWFNLNRPGIGNEAFYIFGTFNEKKMSLVDDGNMVTEAFYAWTPTPPTTVYVIESYLEDSPPP